MDAQVVCGTARLATCAPCKNGSGWPVSSITFTPWAKSSLTRRDLRIVPWLAAYGGAKAARSSEEMAFSSPQAYDLRCKCRHDPHGLEAPRHRSGSGATGLQGTELRRYRFARRQRHPWVWVQVAWCLGVSNLGMMGGNGLGYVGMSIAAWPVACLRSVRVPVTALGEERWVGSLSMGLIVVG